jgi:hypothetical protein
MPLWKGCVVALDPLSALAPFDDPPLEPVSPASICSKPASGSVLAVAEAAPD